MPVDGAGAPPGAEPNRAPLRPLSRELTAALLAAKQARPAMRILFVTDPINDVYGGDPSPELAQLEAAGIEVVRTDLDPLRDSNPAWSGLWRLTMNWWDGDARGEGWLPNPLETGPSRVTFRAWARLLNFKANHRKVLIADDGRGRLVGIVGSANPHDASSAHSNLALELRGEALRPLLRSETEVARFSGWRGAGARRRRRARGGARARAPPSKDARRTGGTGRAAATTATGERLRVRVLTEGAIRDALLERVARRGPRRPHRRRDVLPCRARRWSRRCSPPPSGAWRCGCCSTRTRTRSADRRAASRTARWPPNWCRAAMARSACAGTAPMASSSTPSW